MGRKAKIGKRRKDRFYHLAKEAGYRARSAFKLIQLNRKWHFLQSSRVLVDLCAAPGGWLQVASQFMPVSSLIIGVDLVPIKPVPRVISLQEDITTARCRQALQRELKSWKVDCMLNDGAPNVGSAWVQDAFTQAELSLAAVKLASQFLREGGWFITKVFRSKDYQPLMWVLSQLFKKVSATKPQASRIESAEIFVVCQGYLAPGKVDPKLLDPRYVFQDVAQSADKEKPTNLLKLQKRAKAEGYPDNTGVVYQVTSVADFITGEDYLATLTSSNKLEFDKSSQVFAKHPLTTDDIKEACQDIKLLSPRELKMLVKWREKLRGFLDSVDREESQPQEAEDHTQQRITELASAESATAKRERRRKLAMKRKLRERLVRGQEAGEQETSEITRQANLFSLPDIKTNSHLQAVEHMSPAISSSDTSDSFDSDQTDAPYSDPSDSEQSCTLDQEDSNVIPEPGNPLVVRMEEPVKPSQLWFSKSEFSLLSDDEEQPARHMTTEDSSCEQPAGHMTTEDSSCEPPAAPLKRKLDAHGLALGALLVQSKKKRQDLIEGAYNRWTSNDDCLPDWFAADEAKYCMKQVAVSREMEAEYRSKLRDINTRPIKKVAEAKARKKNRALRKMEKFRKKAEVIADSADASSHEKAQQLRHMYRKAGLTNKRSEVKYVVAKKRNAGKRVARPPGVKGHYKVVDPRMKKDSKGKNKNKKKSKK